MASRNFNTGQQVHLAGRPGMPTQQITTYQVPLDKVSVATHPPSFTNSPVSLPYGGDLKRLQPVYNNLSNPERFPVYLSKSTGQYSPQEVVHIPIANVATNVHYPIEKNKNSTPTYSTSYTENSRVQNLVQPQQRCLRKGSGDLASSKGILGDQPPMQYQRRQNIGQPGAYFLMPQNPVQKYCTSLHDPKNSSPTNIISQYNQNINGSSQVNQMINHEQPYQPEYNNGVTHLMRHTSDVKGSPHSSSGRSQGTPIVGLQFQQPRLEKTRLDHIRSKTYAELVSRPSLPVDCNTQRVMASRYSVGSQDHKTLTNTNSMKQLTLTCSRYDPWTQETSRVKTQEHIPVDMSYNQKPAYTENSAELSNTEPDNAFKKDKGMQNQALKSTIETNPSPQHSAAQVNLKKVRFSHGNQKQHFYTPNDLMANKLSPSTILLFKSQITTKQTKKTPKSNNTSISESPVRMRQTPKPGDFKKIRQLGKGKYGDVYLVQHICLGFICAMKVVQKNQIREDNIIHQFIREIRLQSYLQHENIAQLYGYFCDSERVYILLQYCSGGELSDLLREKKRLTESEASSIIEQICQGVDYMHRSKIMHRDLKPENILLEHNVVKICDFGWAAAMDKGLRQTFCGTPLYVSPQLLRGDDYCNKVDIWAIGILTYELIVGKVPFKIACESDMSKIITDEIDFPDYVVISKEARDFIIRATNKDPRCRTDMDDLLNHPFLTACSKSNDYLRQMSA